MNDGDEIRYSFEKTHGFKPVINFQRKAFRDQKRGWYLRLGWSDHKKVYLGPYVGRALGKLTGLDEKTLAQAEQYAREVAERQAAQWAGTSREEFYK